MANNIEHNTELDDLGKKYLPSGFGKKDPHVDSLAVDRARQAKIQTDDPNEWLELGTDKSDLRGFDSRRNPRTAEKATRRLLYDQGIGYIEQEPDRFLRYDQQSLKLLQQYKDEILDYETFKQALKKAWGSDTSLSRLIDGKYVKESDFKALFEQDLIQSWLNKNAENLAIPLIMRKMNIEEYRAKQVWDRLPARKRGSLLSKVIKGKKVVVKRKTVRPELSAKGKVKLITQTRGGKTYKRTQPRQWTDMQESFIKNNKERGWKWVTEYYNRIFPTPRTKSSIQNKYYRLKK